MKTSESHVFSIYNMLIYTYTTWFRAMCLMYKTMLHIYHQKKKISQNYKLLNSIRADDMPSLSICLLSVINLSLEE